MQIQQKKTARNQVAHELSYKSHHVWCFPLKSNSEYYTYMKQFTVAQ